MSTLPKFSNQKRKNISELSVHPIFEQLIKHTNADSVFDVWMTIMSNETYDVDVVDKYVDDIKEAKRLLSKDGYRVEKGITEFIQCIKSSEMHLKCFRLYMEGNSIASITNSLDIKRHIISKYIHEAFDMQSMFVIAYNNPKPECMENSYLLLDLPPELQVKLLTASHLQDVRTIHNLQNVCKSGWLRAGISSSRGAVITKEDKTLINEKITEIRKNTALIRQKLERNNWGEVCPEMHKHRKSLKDVLESGTVTLIVKDTKGELYSFEFKDYKEFVKSRPRSVAVFDYEYTIMLVLWGKVTMYAKIGTEPKISLGDLLHYFR